MATAQSLQLFDASGTLSTGDTISLDISVEDFDITVPIGITNVSGSAHAVNVTRYEVDVLPNTSSYFCWGSCTGVTPSGTAPVVTPAGSVNMAAGATMSANGNGFLFHYDPNFQVGTSLFRIKFFDVNNPADSADMYISIRSMDYTGIPTADLANLAYPNPVQGALYVPNEGAVLCDLKGERLRELHQGLNDLSDLPAGSYLLVSQGRSSRLIKVD